MKKNTRLRRYFSSKVKEKKQRDQREKEYNLKSKIFIVVVVVISSLQGSNLLGCTWHIVCEYEVPVDLLLF